MDGAIPKTKVHDDVVLTPLVCLNTIYSKNPLARTSISEEQLLKSGEIDSGILDSQY